MKLRALLGCVSLLASGCDFLGEALRNLEAACEPPTIVVNTTDAELDPNAVCIPGRRCTLAAALETADACGGRTIALQQGATYTLSQPAVTADRRRQEDRRYFDRSALPRVRTRVAINGHGATIQRAENSSTFRLLHILPRGDLALNDVTLRGGATSDVEGGAVRNDGRLTLDNVELRENRGESGGAIANYGTLLVRRSRFVQNQAILAAVLFSYRGNVSMEDTVMSENRATDVILFAREGTLELRRSAILESVASSAPMVAGSGTLVMDQVTLAPSRQTSAVGFSGNVSIARSTISGEGAGVECSDARLTIRDSTIVSSLQGVSGLEVGRGCVAEVTNSVVTAPLGQDCRIEGRLLARGPNLDSDGSCGFAHTGDPQLGPLGDWGARHAFLWTHVPEEGSPLVDTGVCLFDADQRDYPRLPPCDIGSVERQPNDP